MERVAIRHHHDTHAQLDFLRATGEECQTGKCIEKRPVPISKLEQIVNEAEGFVIESAERERKTSEVGELIMNRLRRYDKVAYVRFASVYLDFKDVQEFMAELKDLLKTKELLEPQAKSSAKPI